MYVTNFAHFGLVCGFVIDFVKYSLTLVDRCILVIWLGDDERNAVCLE